MLSKHHYFQKALNKRSSKTLLKKVASLRFNKVIEEKRRDKGETLNLNSMNGTNRVGHLEILISDWLLT